MAKSTYVEYVELESYAITVINQKVFTAIVHTNQNKPKLRVFKFKLQWQGTAMKVKIEAPNYSIAERRLKRQLKSMDGGDLVMETIFLGVE